MPAFSHISKTRLETCDPRLQSVFNAIIKVRDCTILEGFRPKIAQDAAFKSGASQTPWPRSKHNSVPSRAVDAIPYPFKEEYWKSREYWVAWSQYVVGFAAGMNIKLRSGYDWDSDFDLKDQTFYDGPHFEVVNE